MKKILLILFYTLLATSTYAQLQVWQYMENYQPVGYQIREIVSTNNKIFYTPHQQMLFCTTGNENSAVILGDFVEISRLTVFGNKVVFSATSEIPNEVSFDYAIWISDGTKAGTYRLTDGTSFKVFKNKIYFPSDRSIYSSDGTPGVVKKILSLPPPPADEQFPSGINALAALDDKLIYNYRGQLGVTDGVSDEVKFLANITSLYMLSTLSTVFNNKLYFAYQTPESGLELWSTDGTDENTVLFKDLNPGTGDGFVDLRDIPYYLKTPNGWFTSSNGKLYFVAYNGTQARVWTTDGTPEKTFELNRNSAGQPIYYTPVSLKSIDGNIYFSNNYSRGFYFSDGSNNTVTNIGGIQDPSDAYSFTKYKDSVYFVASDPDHGYELWKTGNTAESTTRVTDLCPGNCSAINHYTGLAACNDILFFSACSSINPYWANNYQLWKIGGTATPTMPETPTDVVTTGIQEIKYYPNPCHDYISIELQRPASNIRIVSSLGNTVHADWTNENNTIRIQTKNFSAGIYRILIDGNEPLSIIKE